MGRFDSEVGNLAYDVDSQALAMLFEQAGTVEIAEVNIICDFASFLPSCTCLIRPVNYALR